MLGGIVTSIASARTLEEEIAKLKESAGIKPEMKWGRVSAYHYENYRALVDLFFDPPRDVSVPFDFHSLVVDTRQINDRRYNLGDREIGFNKEIYQLILKFIRLYRGQNFHAYLDYRSSRQPVSETRLIVNRGAMSKNPNRDWPIRRLHMRNSKTTLILQLVDVLLGGLAYKLNRHDQMPNASAAKNALSKYIIRRAKIPNVFADTTMAGKFTVWHRQLKR